MKPVTLLPRQPDAPIVQGVRPRATTVRSLLNPVNAFLGRAPGPGPTAAGAGRVDAGTQQLLFTNTRAQAELWHQALASVWPEQQDTLALHHGSLDPVRASRWRTAQRRHAVLWSPLSLDLGVDFPEVEQVLQLEARRASPACASAPDVRAIVPVPAARSCAPSHALELAEYAAVRRALAEGVVEARRPPTLSLDVLAQHAVSRALAGGFHGDALRRSGAPMHSHPGRGPRAVLTFIVQGPGPGPVP